MSVAIPTRFNYYNPKTLEEALKLIGEFGTQCKVLIGGTDLISGVRSEKIKLPKNIIDINQVEDLNFIEDAGDIINIGATTKLSEILVSQIVKNKAPILAEAISFMASVQVRNMGTLGGNLCNASPAADTAPPLLALDAKVEIRSINDRKIVPIDEFFLGPSKTVVAPNEIVTRIEIPTQLPRDKWDFVKLGRRKAFTLSIITLAILARIENNHFRDVRIALGAVAPTPLRIKKAETFLRNKKVGADVIDEASQIVRDGIKPISDVRASEEYRREMAHALTKNALLKLSKE